LPIGRSRRDRKRMSVTKTNSREARTHYKVVERYRSHDVLEVTLDTGRTHQIRVHLSHLGIRCWATLNTAGERAGIAAIDA